MSKATIRVRAALVLLACGLEARGQAPQGLTLAELAQRVLAKSPELAAARARSNESEADERLARDAFAPQAFATTTPGYATGLPVAVAGRVPAVAGIEVRQTIYDEGRRSQVHEARARAAATRGALAVSESEMLRTALLLYARAWTNQELLTAAARRESAQEMISTRADALHREGRLTELDFEKAGLQAALARQKSLDAESDLELDRLELKRLADWPADAPLTLAEDPLKSLPEPVAGETLEAARAADPRLRSLDQQIEALERSAALWNRVWHPVVEAEAQYNRLTRANNFDEFYLRFKADDFSIGVGIAIPLWSGGRFADARARSRSALEGARANRQARAQALELEVRRAQARAARARAQLALSRRAAGVAEEGVRIARVLAQEGRGEANQRETAEAAAASADEETARAAFEAFAARLDLLALRGELLPRLSPSPSAEPKAPEASAVAARTP